MYVSNWIEFPTPLRGTYRGVECRVLSHRAEKSRLLITHYQFGKLDVKASDVTIEVEPVPTSRCTSCHTSHYGYHPDMGDDFASFSTGDCDTCDNRGVIVWTPIESDNHLER